ncbi:uncharacterized protein RHIMIDRAFT_242938 [Rhizopus microsporus ATCC 52813]|uniref:Uncharacterized protein n=2 Tax=Rhizopus microsporus TaxID=58291 RepID=A0A2G4SEH9_RHIZD|nr:uncharacterized protein RHIMIDRAFT_242938 [Rhizopus microsporus ATCC 52813]PHZ07188.1 hypothetical protein RHIMIDRAFT_242938 [Rhizopus microsporus ATCC 52813]
MSNNQENNEITLIQQQLQETRQMLEQLLIAQQQQAAMPDNTSDPQMMMDSSHHPSVSHNTPSPLHSLGTRPQYDWTAPDILSSCLKLDRDLFSTENILSVEYEVSIKKNKD